MTRRVIEEQAEKIVQNAMQLLKNPEDKEGGAIRKSKMIAMIKKSFGKEVKNAGLAKLVRSFCFAQGRYAKFLFCTVFAMIVCYSRRGGYGRP